MDSNQRLRARIILGGIVVVACGLAATLYSIQITNGSSYLTKANKQYDRPGAHLFDRGTIFMSGKDDTRPAAATLTSTYIISMTPRLIGDGAGTYEALSHYMDIDKDDFMMKTTFASDPYEEIARKVDDKTAQSIKSLALPGIAVTKESKRSYPGGEIAAHAIGIIGEGDDGTIEGKYGLERTYDGVLSRSGASASGSIFAQLFGDSESFSGGMGGEGDIVTSLEPTVQAYLEKVLAKTSMTWKPDEIGGIIIDPSTGEIVAAAALPAFDPNDLSKISSAAVLSNPLIENVYEMGSIIKPLTVATGLDSGAITTSSTYNDTGTLTLSGRKISNFDGKARGVVNAQEILSQSLNVGAATIALKVGKDTFTDYFTESFGLGEKSGIDQPNESTGLLANLKSGRDIEIATAAYGQGIAMSPIATTRALSALANGGMLITPHFVKEIDYVDGTKKMLDFGAGKRVLKQQSSDDVTRMLVKVVDTALRNGTLKLDGYSVAAKTGTAQIPDSVSKKYFDDRYLHSFFGYFPAYDAKFLVFLYQKYPKGAQYASETLAEPFHDLTKFLIDYYNVPPDR